MGLRDIAQADLKTIMEDADTGFGWSFAITDPDEKSESLVGRSNDIGLVIDPDTGMAVSGRLASIAIQISSLIDAGFTELPRGIADDTLKPWIIVFDDINFNAFTFKVSQSNPDRTLGIITCTLELYE
jgi:hypothetical protein